MKSSLLLPALSSLCIGFGLAWPLLLALDIAAPPGLCAACCAGVALLFALGDAVPRLRALVYPALLAALLAGAFVYRAQLAPLANALTLLLNGQPLALLAFRRPVTLVISLLLGAVGAALARSDQAFFPLAFLSVFELLILSLLGLHVPAAAFLPLMAALLLCARARSVGASRLLPMAALVLLGALALMPLSGATVPVLERAALRVQRAIGDYLFFTQPRTAFSLASTGYQPLGAERLGGPAQPTDDPVMQVRTPQRALLRATVKNEYTGLAWADTTSGRRYLLVSPRFAALRRDLFDLNRPEKDALALLPGARTLEVSMRADSASTLFLTQRFSSPKGDGVVSYFSPSSEVFATRSLQTGDGYTFSGRLLDASTEGARRAVLAALDETDPYYPSVRSVYMNLPQAVEPEVYQIASAITEGADNPFDRAAALCLYLQRGFAYTLDQAEPPVTRDFVSWFLLEEKRGYCTSFASALAVLARAGGMPARYVEGYAAQPDSDGVARVTQQNAHAWTEIYFPGFGWMTFDPTPGSGRSPDSGGNPPPQSAPDDPDDPSGASGSPSPSPTPSPVPTPTPSPTPAHNDPAVTPTPPITPAPTQPPTPAPSDPPPPPDREDDPPLPPALWLLLALLLLALAALRLHLVSPARVAASVRSPNDRVLVWYRASAQALAALGIAQRPGEAPASYLLRAQESLSGQVPLLRLGKDLCVARYSGKRLKPAAAERAERIYRALCARMTLSQRLRMIAARFVRGLPL